MTETVLSCGECNNKDQYKDILNKSRDLNGKKKEKKKERNPFAKTKKYTTTLTNY